MTARTQELASGHVRHADDDYATPEWCVAAIWPHVRPVSGIILDPCAGAGAIVRALTDWRSRSNMALAFGQRIAKELDPHDAPACRWPSQHVHARELSLQRSRAIHVVHAHEVSPPIPYVNVVTCDWLAYDEPLRPRLILTNPPYKLAFEFVQKAVALVQHQQGTVCMLLRLAFLASQRRQAWLRDHTPSVYVLSRRPSFTPDGKTDSSDYAWMVWRPGKPQVHIL